MARFVNNLERNGILERFCEDQKVLCQDSLHLNEATEVEEGVTSSFKALGELLTNKQSDNERLKNSENSLYLQLMEHA